MSNRYLYKRGTLPRALIALEKAAFQCLLRIIQEGVPVAQSLVTLVEEVENILSLPPDLDQAAWYRTMVDDVLTQAPLPVVTNNENRPPSATRHSPEEEPEPATDVNARAKRTSTAAKERQPRQKKTPLSRSVVENTPTPAPFNNDFRNASTPEREALRQRVLDATEAHIAMVFSKPLGSTQTPASQSVVGERSSERIDVSVHDF